MASRREYDRAARLAERATNAARARDRSAMVRTGAPAHPVEMEPLHRAAAVAHRNAANLAPSSAISGVHSQRAAEHTRFADRAITPLTGREALAERIAARHLEIQQIRRAAPPAAAGTGGSPGK